MKLNKINNLINKAEAERQIAEDRYWHYYKLEMHQTAELWDVRRVEFDKLITKLKEAQKHNNY